MQQNTPCPTTIFQKHSYEGRDEDKNGHGVAKPQMPQIAPNMNDLAQNKALIDSLYRPSSSG